MREKEKVWMDILFNIFIVIKGLKSKIE